MLRLTSRVLRLEQFVSLSAAMLALCGPSTLTAIVHAQGDEPPVEEPAAPGETPIEPDTSSEPAAVNVEEDDAALEAAAMPEGSKKPDQTDPTQSGLLSDEQAMTEEKMGVERTRPSTDPYEQPDKRYFFVGAFYRHAFVPEAILNLFADESTRARNPQVGAEFTIRKNGFDIITSLYYAQFKANGPFLGKNDTDTEVEIIDSNLQAIFAGVDLLWGTSFHDIVALQYGVGFGAGVMFGDVVRTEAYPNTGPGSNNGFSACNGPQDPDGTFCDATSVGDGEDGGHFGVVSRRWTDGGSVPNFWFRAALPHLALRIKPIRQLLIRLDGGFDLFSGLFVGGALAYGL